MKRPEAQARGRRFAKWKYRIEVCLGGLPPTPAHSQATGKQDSDGESSPCLRCWRVQRACCAVSSGAKVEDEAHSAGSSLH